MSNERSEEEVIAAIDVEPFARALIHPNGDVVLTPWSRGLRLLPTEQDTFRSIVEQGIRIVDLRRLVSPAPTAPELLAVRELFATSLDIEGNDLNPEAQMAIVEWATGLGYSRCWTDNFGLFELPGEVSTESVATAECDHCHTSFRDGSFSFWRHCFEAGVYPSCQICRAAMAWHVDAGNGASEEQRAARAAIQDIVLDSWTEDPHEFPISGDTMSAQEGDVENDS